MKTLEELNNSGPFNAIYLDPPWSYKNGGRGAAINHYQDMSMEEIENLPIEKIAAEDCFLFCWVTFPMLHEYFALLSAWPSFEYVTNAFTWVKKNKVSDSLFWGGGMAGTRSNAEVCLMARKGKPKRVSASVHSVIISPVDKHSKKPDEARERIVELCGDVPRIELFARGKPRDGWVFWGNEVEE